jgi:hypothetical protein
MLSKCVKKILLIILPFLFFACKNISSQYGEKNIINKKICVYINIENNAQRMFTRRIKENPNVVDIENCDYLLLAELLQSQSDILNNFGIRIESKITMHSSYFLYKNDISKIEQIKSILETPDIRTYEQYTGKKGGSLSKGPGVATNEHQEKNYEISGSHSVYIGTKARIDKILKQISEGDDFADSVYMVNNALLTGLQQSKEDIEYQLSRNLAEKVIDDAIFDIMNFEKSEHIKKCRAYYDKYVNIYFNEKEIKYLRQEGVSNDKLLETECENEFNMFQKENEKNEQNIQKKYEQRIKKERNIRYEIFKSGKQSEIEQYSLHEKKRKNKQKQVIQ